ncbi:hypothetical protein AVEN_9625-1 [Araneus ventricosus]|uniref:Uncharacterized protein n=1 Tax=Araneus ventricosus TaxID=182803 RepID=A0A4Y2EV26_ARAVE|nr:hypothetical protein AVEN_9625-1 [Araneus ventricosus]
MLKRKTRQVHPNQRPCSSTQRLRGKESGQITQNGIKIGRDFQIKDVRKLQNGGIAVDCPSQQDVDKILERIGKSPSLQEKIKPISIKKHLQKSVVYGLEPEFTREQIEASLSQSFGDVHKDLKVLFPIKGRTGKNAKQSVKKCFQTPVYIYRQLRRQKLTIDWETHTVKEFLSARKCSKCQSLEHTTTHYRAERTFVAFALGTTEFQTVSAGDQLHQLQIT